MKKNNSLLITILSGAVFCFVCLGMVFLFPSNRKLKTNQSTLPNADEHGYVESEISLGDIAHCEAEETTTYNTYSCGSWKEGTSSNACATAGGNGSTECLLVHGINSSTCYQEKIATPHSTTKCTQCDPAYSLNSEGTACTPKSCSSIEGSTTCTSRSDCEFDYTNGCHDKPACAIANCVTYACHTSTCCSCNVCDPGMEPSSDGKSCVAKQCGANQHLDGNDCVCDLGYKASSDGKSCTPKSCVSISGSSECSARSDCEFDYTNGCHDKAPTCGANQHWDASQGKCVCDSGYELGSDSTTCTPKTKCGAGQGKDESQSSGCGNCAAGYYSPANDDDCHKCEYGKVSGPGSASCRDVAAPCCVTNPTGSRTTYEDLSACQQAVKGGATVTNGKCPETTNPVVTRVSSSVSGTIYLNSNDVVPTNSSDSTAAGSYGYKTVTYVAYDQNNQVISGTKLSWSVSNNSVVASKAANGTGYTVTYKGLGCNQPNATVSVTARGTGDVTGSATSNSITIVTQYHAWAQSEYNSANTNNYPHLHDGYESNSCIAVSDPYEENGVTKYKYQYNRCCGSTPGTPTTPVTPPNPEVPYCYIDNDGEYHWSVKSETSWKLVDTVTKEADCQKVENEACYINPNGGYVWGKYAKQTGYTLITSISSSALCKAPTQDTACYKNDQGDYIWIDDAPEGYTKVDTIKTPAECAPVENPGCYLNGNKFVWGKYERVTGYIFVENIEEEKYCKTPDVDACYVDSIGNYVWGKYGDNSDYTLVPSVTDMSKCNNIVPTPGTGVSASKLLYIFMAILMAFGVGFIYYSSTAKKKV